ncbi:hypothetical protein [Streptomyces sp.]|uniref:hypothetical protein n=1 Tax=Streptomyces sp. TaxID=1931 RepID=UPI002F94062D
MRPLWKRSAWTTRIRATATAALLAAVAAVPAQAAAAQTAVPPQEHICFSPDGTELNSFLGIADRIIGPPTCREAFAGERLYRSFFSWGTAQPREAGDPPLLYPPDYVTSLPDDPMRDFRSKLVGVRVVHDINTVRERSYSFGQEIVRRTETFEGDGNLYAWFAAGPLHPLSVGTHTSTVFMRLTAEHCDGITTDRESSCLPAGEFLWSHIPVLRIFPRNP